MNHNTPKRCMTLYVETLSHGEIESGFFASFTQYARLGDYAFSTRHFCELIKYLAENPETKSARLHGHTVQQFWKKQDTYLEGLIKTLQEADSPDFEEFDKNVNKKLDNYFKDQQKEELNLEDDTIVLNIKVKKDYSSIKIGKYEIAPDHFRIFSKYLAQGGFLGWKDPPDYSKPTLEAIKKSSNPLFKKA